VVENNFLLRLQAIPNSEKEELLDLPRYFVKTHELDEYIGILLDFQFVTAKISILDVEPLIEDYNLLEENDLSISAEDKSSLNAIQKIYRLVTTLHSNLPGLEDWLELSKAENSSKQMLLEYSYSSTYREIQSQLATQLWGRFSYASSCQMLRSLLDQARDSQNEPWLRPVFPTLTNPSSHLERVLTGHQSNITAIAITPDGKHLISGEIFGKIILWDLEKEIFIKSFDDHATPQIDWDYVAGSAQMRIGNNYITDILVTQDSKYFISGAYDGILIVWDIKKQRKLHELVHVDHRELQHKTIFQEIWKTSRNIVPDSDDEKNYIEELSRWRSNIGTVVHSCTLNGDNTKLIASYFDQSLVVWDIETGKELQIITYPRLSYSYNISFSNIIKCIPYLNQILLRTSAEDVLIYELDAEQKLSPIGTIEVWENDFKVSFKNFVTAPNGELIIFEGGSCFWIWSVRLRKFTKKIDIQNKSYIQCLQITPDSKWLISISADKTLIITDISTSQIIAKIAEQEIVGEWKVVISPNGKDMIGYVGDKKIKIWNLSKLESLSSNDLIQDESQFEKTVYDITFTPDGKKLVLGRGNYKIKILDWADNCNELSEIDGNKIFSHSQYIRAITISPNGQRVISSSAEGNVHVWDINSGQMLIEFLCHPHIEGRVRDIDSIAITPDAERVITASADYSLKIWELKQIKIGKTGQILVKPSLYKNLVGHTDEVKSVVITPNGKRAISGSEDGTVKVWDILTGIEIQTFNCQPTDSSNVSKIGTIFLSSDGNQVFSVNQRNPEIKVWDLESQENCKTLDLGPINLTFGGLTYGDIYTSSGSISFHNGSTYGTDGHKSPITDIVVTPDNRYLVTCSYYDSTLMLWDLRDICKKDSPVYGDKTTKFRPKFLSSISFDTLLKCCAISPDGKTIAVGDEFNNAHILQIENAEFDKSIDLSTIDRLSSNLTFEDNILSLELYKAFLDEEEKQSISKFPRFKLFVFTCFVPFVLIITISSTQVDQVLTYLLSQIPSQFSLYNSILYIRVILELSMASWLYAIAMKSLAGKARSNINRISENIEKTFIGLIFLYLAYLSVPIFANIGSTGGNQFASKEYWIVFIFVSLCVFISTTIEKYIKTNSLEFINPIVLIGSSLAPLLGSHQVLGSIYWSAIFSIMFTRVIDASNQLLPLKKVVYLISISCGIMLALAMNYFLNSDSVYWDATIRVVLGIFIWNIAFHSDKSYALKNLPIISLISGLIVGIILNTFLQPTFLKFISSSLINICSTIGFLLGGALGLIGAWIIAAAMFGLIYILFILPFSIVDEGLQRLIFQVRPRTN
jgi:WD40 repeat protein